ncbi:MAG: asparagine synthase (glutamine-hydrolyzing) [Clostridia bacterium]|nr:asparagine synthase (glutamine-hydrolyzing) [Clostridia bacterium]
MCGIAGFTGEIENQKQILENMMARIIHRGPDMGGEYISGGASLGFRRLSIIDLSENGCQPLYNENKDLVLVFNGEIYNFETLREELKSFGHVFVSKTDSEVIIHSYEQWGRDCVKRLRGMFAFVIWDTKDNSLFAARDIFGIKPFYYHKQKNGDLIFGSEIKSFLEHPGFMKKVNKDALLPYLTLQYSATEETFFENTYKLLPGHTLFWKDGKTDIQKYHDFKFEQKDGDLEEYTDKLCDVINDSVKVHRISDVPVGGFLSGGVDSSYITAELMPDKTFSVGFKFDNFDETDDAKELSDILKIQNYKKYIDADECFEAFSDIQYHMDEPQSNPSCVPLWFLAKLAKEHVTVVLSGEGADEIFAGYDWYCDTPEVVKFKKLPAALRRFLASIVKPLPEFKGRSFLLRSSGVAENYFLGQAFVFPEKEAKRVLKPDCAKSDSASKLAHKFYLEAKELDEVTQKQYLDFQMWLPGDILLKADKMSMAHSLELRVPYLDKEVMALAEQIPLKYKICDKGSKYILRHAADKKIPKDWAFRKKKGFPVPIRMWLKEEKYYNIVKEYFASDYAEEFFDRKAIMKLLDDLYRTKANNGRKIWTIFTFLVWYKRFFIDEKSN